MHQKRNSPVRYGSLLPPRNAQPYGWSTPPAAIRDTYSRVGQSLSPLRRTVSPAPMWRSPVLQPMMSPQKRGY